MSWTPTPKLDNPQHERAAHIVFVVRQRENYWNLARDALIEFLDLGPEATAQFCGRIDTLTVQHSESKRCLGCHLRDQEPGFVYCVPCLKDQEQMREP